MKFLWLALVVLSPSVWAQTSTTNTNCNASGSSINCTSQTTDNNSQKQAYEAGQQVGAALGTGIAAAMNGHAQSHWVKKFCEGHPGEGWKWRRNSDGALLASGRCPTFGDRAVQASNQFMGRHRNIISGQENETAIAAYIAEHRLNPSEEKSYERAYKDLKKSGKLELYSN